MYVRQKIRIKIVTKVKKETKGTKHNLNFQKIHKIITIF